MIRTYNNENGINKATFELPVNYYCPLGRNYSRATVKVEMELGNKIAELLDISDYFRMELNGAKLTQEGLCGEIFLKMCETYEPRHISVKVFADGHVPMTVEKYF